MCSNTCDRRVWGMTDFVEDLVCGSHPKMESHRKGHRQLA